MGADDAAEAAWFPVGELPPLAFDHQDVVGAPQGVCVHASACGPRGASEGAGTRERASCINHFVAGKCLLVLGQATASLTAQLQSAQRGDEE